MVSTIDFYYRYKQLQINKKILDGNVKQSVGTRSFRNLKSHGIDLVTVVVGRPSVMYQELSTKSVNCNQHYMVNPLFSKAWVRAVILASLRRII